MNDYKEVFDDVRTWQGIHENPVVVPPREEYWKDFFWWGYKGGIWEFSYVILQKGLDPFIEDLVQFFKNITDIYKQIYEWIVNRWKDLAGWISEVRDRVQEAANYIYNFPLNAWLWIEGYWGKIIEYIKRLASAIWEWITGKWEEILDYAWKLAWSIWDWIDRAWDYIAHTVQELIFVIWDSIRIKAAGWYEPVRAWILEKWVAIRVWILEKWEWLKAMFWPWMTKIWEWLVEKVKIAFDIRKARIIDTWPSVKVFLGDILKEIWEYMLKTIAYIKDRLIDPAVAAIQKALSWLWEKFKWIINRAYVEIWDLVKGFAPVTPARSFVLAGMMFGSAVGLGAAAHSLATSVEATPGLKNYGVHYLSAFAARMGGFGAISTATMGVIAAVSLRTPFTYYVNSLLRPTIPDERLLIEFRAKREITLPEFYAYMKYHGYSDSWIKKTDSWLWKDPRLFEILYLTDVTVPTADWLKRKFERAGYEDVDVKYMVRTAQMRTTKSPRTYVMTAMRRNYRHGFLTERELTEGVEALEVAPDAIDWIKRAGELDNIYEINTDLVTAYRTAYRNDLISEEECAASLAALGLPPARVDAVVYLEWVRKTPSALKAERKEVEAEWREVQKEYSRIYIECFQKGLITEEQLAGYLEAIGIKEKVARMTARYEALKLLPKPKPEPMPEFVPPPPVPPPEYEE